MSSINSFKDLIVWQKSMELAEIIYKISDKLPHKEVYGLVNQLQRSAVSIPSNIAEGSKRGSRKDYAQFLRISLGSSAEVETQLLLVRSIYSINVDAALVKLNEVQRMLEVLKRKIVAS